MRPPIQRRSRSSVLDEGRLVRLQRAWERAVRAAPLLGWISYVPLLCTLGALLLVIAGVGKRLGIPSLIWHDSRSTQLLAGIAAAGLSLHLGLVGYLLDDQEEDAERALLPTYDPNDDSCDATIGRIARYVRWPCGALLLCTFIGLFRHGEVRWYGALVMVGPVVAFLLLMVARNSPRRLSRAPARTVIGKAMKVVRKSDQKARWVRQVRVDEGAHALQAASMAALAILYAASSVFRQIVPAAVALSLALALVTGLWGLFAFWMQRYRLIGMGGLVLLAFALGVTKDVAPRGLTDVQLTCEKSPGRALISNDEALRTWKAGLVAAGETRPPLVVVVTSGGASRAAVWTITMLAELESRLPGFMRHVRIITGASGGMVGAAHYVSALGSDARLSPETLREIREAAGADSLTAVARALILPGGERGSALENAWERNSGGRLAASFMSLSAGEQQGWRPSLIFAPVMVEDGRRLLISNLDLASLTTAPAPLLRCEGAGCGQSQSAVQLFACPGEGLDKLRISTVARMNATFPWVTSAALLPSHPRRRIVDAGYYDNYGVNIAAAWLTKNAAWLRDNTSGVLLVQLRDSHLDSRHWNVLTPDGPGYFHEWFSAVTTPIEAFLNVQDSSMSFRNDGEISLLAAHPLLANPQRFFVTIPFEFGEYAPLNWYLSREDIGRLVRPPPAEEFNPLVAWWRERNR